MSSPRSIRKQRGSQAKASDKCGPLLPFPSRHAPGQAALGESQDVGHCPSSLVSPLVCFPRGLLLTF